jgi:hypothetical protein
MPLVINRAVKTHFIRRNLYKTYKTIGFVPGSNFFLTFCTTQDENQSTLVSYAPSNVMLHLPAKADKESEAKKGIVKLMLFHIRGNINIEATSVSNITPAIPLKEMRVVLNQPCTARASQFADLLQMT